MIEIQDMYLAAALLSYGFVYKGVDKSDPKKQRFIFEDGELFVGFYNPSQTVVEEKFPIEKVEKLYVSNSLWYPPGYPDALRKIKYIIHSEEDKNGYKFSRTGSSSVLSNSAKVYSVG